MKINILLFLSLLFLFSCGKDNDTIPSEPSNIPTGTFNAEIDGELFNSPTSATAVLSVLDTSILNTTIFQLNGTDLFSSGLFKNMIIIFSAENLSLEETTYSSSGECNATILCPQLIYTQQGNSENDPDNFSSGSNAPQGDFSITFSELDFRVGGKAIGTFSGTILDETNQVYREVTNGKFDLSIL